MGASPTSDHRYRECLDYLHGRLNYERLGMPRGSSELQIGRMCRLLAALGDPRDALRVIHVAGTKGKGSTSAMLASALTASGRRTGLFTSPHLHRLEERYRVDGVEASADALCDLVEEVRPVVDRLDRENERFIDRPATFFEITTAMGLLHFARSGARHVVLEVGLGGRLDSTNVVRPVVSVITSISLDHTRLLGSTTARIAREKAGIIKRGRPTVSSVTDADAAREIRAVAAARRSPLREVGVDFRHEYHPPRPPIEEPSPGTFHARTWRTDWGILPVPLIGPHQAANATAALATLDVLAEEGIVVEKSAVEAGFRSVVWPARVEIMGRDPWIVVDGAHNLASAEALAETLRRHFPPVPRTLVFGTTKEKDLEGQLRTLTPLFDTVIATRYRENPRAVPIEEVAAAIPEAGAPRVVLADDPAEALARARELTPSRGLICVTGSLFLAGETRAILLGDASLSTPESARAATPAP